MADLSDIRKEIDQIDRELVALLDRRAGLARKVGEAKADTGRPTFDAGRHRAVIERALGHSDGSFPREGLNTVMREVLSVCLNLQKPLKVAYLGPAATFSHQAALGEFGSSVEYEPYQKIGEIFQAVHHGRADYGVVPVENSTGGMIHETLDSFAEFTGRICHEILLPIENSLLSNHELGEIKVVYSHPQPFAQCMTWLRAHLPGVELQEMPSTVAGMQKAKTTPNSAAIGSHIAGDIYGLRILARGIQDSRDNTTRFVVIAKTDTPPCGDDKTSLMFSFRDRPGALFEFLKPFASRQINLSKIESRPTRKRAWEYVFFIDVIGHRLDAKVQAAIDEMTPNCEWVRVLGSYPRFRAFEDARISAPATSE